MGYVICFSVRVSVCPCVCLCVCLSVCLSFHVYLCLSSVLFFTAHFCCAFIVCWGGVGCGVILYADDFCNYRMGWNGVAFYDSV